MDIWIAYRDEYLGIGFTPPELLNIWTKRVEIFVNIIKSFENTKIFTPEPAQEEELMLAHTRSYIEYVKEKGEKGKGYLDYGDTPAYPNIYEKARLAIGGTLSLAKKAFNKQLSIGFNPQGGFHHAKSNAAGGFCVFNDLAISARFLLKRGLRRIAIVDIDGHHGDGTQSILYSEPLLKISVHRYGLGFYPGTGWIDELGTNEGYGFSINIPLPIGSGDDIFMYVIDEVIMPLIKSYKPEFLILQLGVDGHLGDPLVGLRYTSKGYGYFSSKLREYIDFRKVPVVCTGGGGYQPEISARMWALMLCILAGMKGEIDYLRDREEGTVSGEETWRVMKKRVKTLKDILSSIHNI